LQVAHFGKGERETYSEQQKIERGGNTGHDKSHVSNQLFDYPIGSHSAKRRRRRGRRRQTSTQQAFRGTGRVIDGERERERERERQREREKE